MRTGTFAFENNSPFFIIFPGEKQFWKLTGDLIVANKKHAPFPKPHPLTPKIILDQERPLWL